MAETKKKLELLGHLMDVTEIPVTRAEEKFVQYELEDGSVIKIKGVAASIMRVDNQYLPDGSPVYLVAMNAVVSVLSSLIKKPAPAVPPDEPKKLN